MGLFVVWVSKANDLWPFAFFSLLLLLLGESSCATEKLCTNLTLRTTLLPYSNHSRNIFYFRQYDRRHVRWCVYTYEGLSNFWFCACVRVHARLSLILITNHLKTYDLSCLRLSLSHWPAICVIQYRVPHRYSASSSRRRTRHHALHILLLFLFLNSSPARPSASSTMHPPSLRAKFVVLATNAIAIHFTRNSTAGSVLLLRNVICPKKSL